MSIDKAIANNYSMLNSDLKALLEIDELKGISFGRTKVQRHLIIGYNRTCHLIDAAIEQGILIRDKECPHLFRIKA